MKITFSILSIIMLGYLLFILCKISMDFANVPAHDIEVNSKDIFDCFNKENFEICYKYVHWKHYTAKKLSPDHFIILDSEFSVEAAEDEQGKFLKFYKNNELYFKVDAQKGVIPIFIKQKDSYVQTCEKLFCDLVGQAKNKNLSQNYVYIYVDGNGNHWKITENKLAYLPVKPENSSSGVYSGGKSFEVDITFIQFQEAEQIFLKALKDNTQHQAERAKGTGALSQQVENAIVQRCFLIGSSPQKENIETYLQSFKP